MSEPTMEELAAMRETITTAKRLESTSGQSSIQSVECGYR
jgi:hypothetical protein